ncbi:MAG: hypothetical protein LBD79_07650 [Treponema sp.]|nr:hypothetical protein [Treponema sp.]
MSITETHAVAKRGAGVTFFLLYFTFFAPLCLLTAQTVPTERFVQRLTWEPDPAASHYEVIVERLDRNRGEVLRETSAQAFLDCSLAPGQYRCQVRVYDLFGRVGATSEWMFFEVVQPYGNSVQRLNWEPEVSASYYEVVVEQQDSSSQYHELARKITEEPFIDSALPIGQYRYKVTVYDVFGNEADSEWSYFEVVFSPPEVVAIAQPAFEPESALILPEPEPPPPEPAPEPEPPPPLPQTAMDIVIQAAYSPFVTLPSGFFNDPSMVSFFPAGASLKLNFIPLKARTRGLGFGFVSSWNYQNLAGHIWNTHLGLVFRQWLSNHVMAFNFWLGGGFSWIYNDSYTWLSSMSGGVSFQWFIRRPFFVTVGVDFAHILSNDSPLYVQPSLGFGWQF